MNQVISTDDLLTIATALGEASEREDWETALPLIEQLGKLVLARKYATSDTPAMKATIEQLNSAIQAITRRKEEIRTLLNRLSSEQI